MTNEELDKLSEGIENRPIGGFNYPATKPMEQCGTDAQQLKPKMPDYLELLSTIDDSRLTVMEGKADVRVGTRLMYDSLVRHFGH